MKIRNVLRRYGAPMGTGTAVALALVSTSASAQTAFTLDSSPVTSIVATVLAFIVSVGTAVLGLHFTAKGFKWARRAG